MCKKLIYLVSFVLVLGLPVTSPVQAVNIIWVSDAFDDDGDGAPDDLAWVELLEAQGHTVDYADGYWRTLDDDKIAALNAAHLIIVSRCSNSGDYDDGSEPTQWNSVTTPLILQTSFLMRNNRWLWFDTGDLSGGTSMMDVLAPDHPIFAGVTSPVQALDVTMGRFQFPIAGVSVGNGTLLAQTDTGEPWIAVWEPGVEFYPGSGQIAGGPRMFFVAGTQDVSGVTGRGMYNLTPEGETIFLNAIRYMLGASKRVKAYNPEPDDGSFHEDTWINLSWRPGDFAVSHDVYFGDNFDDVSAGAESTFQGNQTSTFLVVGFPGFAYPDGLVLGTTYYWRVDEVNEQEPNSPWQGNVWSFMVPPETAYAPDPADAAEQVDPDVDLSWTGGFGTKLHYVYFGDNFDDVNSASGGPPLGVTTYTPGPLKTGKTYYWRVDEFDAVATYKGHVWSFTTEGGVGSPDPSNGAVDVKHTPILTWSPGVYSASHQIYFGTDKEVVRNANTGSPEYKGAGDLGSQSYDPGKLEWDTTYYWRIDEANNANADSPWKGPVWSFTTANFLIVDDFEDYDAGENQIWFAWHDGFGYGTPGTEPYSPGNGTGSAVGDESTPSYTEETIVHGGSQSMPVFYDNSVLMYSEVEKTLTYPRDWTENGISTLSIWFRGNSDNAAETLYVALNDSAAFYHDNPNVAQTTLWTEWRIDLQEFADQAVNLTNVDTIAIGLGNKKNLVAGGSGKMYFDDIRLYRP